MRIHYLQHVPFEDLASIQRWAESENHSLSVTQFHDNGSLPDIDAIDWLIILGGPMSVNDEDKYAWLLREKRFIEEAVRKEKIVLGICLGAQLIASVLGAPVYGNPCKEIGWFPVRLTSQAEDSPLFNFLPRSFNAFHWHGETHDLPRGAVHMAESDACRHQAFVYGVRVVGLQFHLESTMESIEALVQNCSSDITEGPCVQSVAQMLSCEEDCKRINRAMQGILERICAQGR